MIHTATRNLSPEAGSYYDAKYFDLQKSGGEFGGWANSYKFRGSVSPEDTVIDFGCGGGFLLNNLICSRRIGIEPNSSASDSIRSFGIQHFYSPAEALSSLGEGIADVIVSNHALEHTPNPLQELRSLRPLLKDGGTIHFVVPCETIGYRYNPNDLNYHLFSWSPQSLGNLFTEAGFTVEYSRPLIHKWPPHYQRLRKLGWPLFDIACRLYGRLERSSFQVDLRAKKLATTRLQGLTLDHQV